MTQQESPRPTDEHVRQAYMTAARLMRDGHSHADIVKNVVRMGFSLAQAEVLVVKLEAATDKAIENSEVKTTVSAVIPRQETMNQATHQAYQIVAEMIAEGRSEQYIADQLVYRGRSREQAEAILDTFRAHSKVMRIEENVERSFNVGWKMILIGAVLAVVSCAFAVLNPKGGYIIGFGILLSGILRVIWATSKLR